MTRLDFRTVVALVFLAAAAGCKGDPTADLRGGPAILSLNPDLMFIDQGTSKGLEVVVRDQQLNPVAAAVTATTSNAAVMTVAPDTLAPSADNARYNFNVTAVGPGQAKVVVTSAGITDSATVTVIPTAFNGVFSSTTPKGGDTVTIAATALLKFDTATVAVTAPGNLVAPVVFKSADSIKVLAPFADGPWTIAGVSVTYVPGLTVSLATAPVTATGRFWAGDTTYTTAPTIVVPATAGRTYVITNLAVPDNGPHCAEFGPPAPGNSVGPCVIYKFTLADTTTLRFSTGWDGAADLDTYVCTSTGLAGCGESGFAGAGSANPEVIPNFKYPAGTHYLVVEQFRGPAPSNIMVTVIHP